VILALDIELEMDPCGVRFAEHQLAAFVASWAQVESFREDPDFLVVHQHQKPPPWISAPWNPCRTTDQLSAASDAQLRSHADKGKGRCESPTTPDHLTLVGSWNDHVLEAMVDDHPAGLPSWGCILREKLRHVLANPPCFGFARVVFLDVWGSQNDWKLKVRQPGHDLDLEISAPHELARLLSVDVAPLFFGLVALILVYLPLIY